MRNKLVLLLIVLILTIFITLSGCGDIQYEYIEATVVDIQMHNQTAVLTPTFYYITVTFDNGMVRNFNDWYLDDFQIGQEYSLTIHQSNLSRPVWVIKDGLNDK